MPPRPTPTRAALSTDGPRARDRIATAERILAAVGVVLARDGFDALGVNAIAREAGVDKVLIYRYFGGLPELLKTWGASGRFWPRVEDLLGDDPTTWQALPPAERYGRFFEHLIEELRRRPLTLQILAAELLHRNELTAVLEDEREQWGRDAARLLGGPELLARPFLQDVTLLLVAGVQYLLLRSRHIRRFGALDLHADADWTRLARSLRQMATLAFDAEVPALRRPAAARRRPPASGR